MSRWLASRDRLVDVDGMDYRDRVSERLLGLMLEGLEVAAVRGAEHVAARRVVEDSRMVQPGDIFLARAGQGTDGRRFIAAAEAAGAVAILSDQEGCAATAGPALLADDAGATGAILAHRLQGDPSATVAVIGVTGTNGKTTVSTVAQHLAGGSGACGLLGGVVMDDGARRTGSALTTPMAVDIANWLGATRQNGCGAAAMEVSSHALDQGRVRGVRFTAAVCTNLSGDHLDYHGTMEAYAASKRSLFRALGAEATAIINADDPAAAAIAEDTAARVVRCSLDGDADVEGRVVALNGTGTVMTVAAEGREATAHVPLLGRHNAMNVLQAVAAVRAIGVPFELAVQRVATATSPRGRLEPVCDRPRVLIDFAHTDGALAAVLHALRGIDSGRIIVVVGCGGDRDRSKRPRMAQVACSGADSVWLTSDNPRTEPPEDILRDMVQGIPAGRRSAVMVEVDRRAAIAGAIAQAGPDDCVLIAGKGHETVQLVAGEAIPFDDREVAADCLRMRRAGS